MASTPPARVVLVGAGRVGTAVAVLLQRAGLEVVGVSSRTEASQHAAAKLLDSPEFDLSREFPSAGIVLVGAGDDALTDVASALAERVERDAYVCHFSGSVGVGPLAPIAAAGARAVALHPVQACPDLDTAIERLPGSAWGVTCEAADVEWAQRLVRELKGRPVHVAEEDRPAWHAAAVMVSNGIAALLAVGESMLDSIGVESPEVVLGPIAAGTVQNARDGGGGAATLTGPVVRGETHIIDRHLRAFADSPLTDEYAQVVKMIVTAARAARRIEADVADQMLRRLESR
jgi:predicted short-subunit dehydrogenase-like oxidoreductase (DUF2520 family)